MSRPNRRAGLIAANSVVVGYVVAGALAVVADIPDAVPGWLVVHLLLLGAATNAIVVWGGYFVSTHLQQPPLPPAAITARLVALNLSILAVLAGVQAEWRALTIAGATALAMTLAMHLATLIRSVYAGRGRRFAFAMRFYWTATAAVLLGISAGTALIAGVPSVWWGRVYAVHVHLNLLGWVALTVLGTQFSLWPTALRTRMAVGSDEAARRALVATAVGLVVAVTGLLAGWRWLAVAGLVIYAVGVADFLVPFLRTVRQRVPRSPATLMLAASTGWLCAAIVVDLVELARPAQPNVLAGRVSTIVPWMVAGFVVQVLLGALSYLIPVALGGPPAVGKRTAAAMARWGVARVLTLNAGVALVALTGSHTERLLTGVGWGLIAAAVLAFVGLAALATARARRR